MQAEVIQTKTCPAFRVNGELETGFAFCTVAQDLSAENREAAARRIAEFRDAGIHWYTFGLGLDAFLGQKSFWNGPGIYDFAVLDGLLRFVSSIDKNARILLRVALDAPEWWKAAHPDEIAVGWSKDKGYFKEDWLQSFSSRAWRHDAGEALKNYIRHIEQNFSENVIGYHLCAEASHEWSYGWWGKLHDYSPAHVLGFREWLKLRHAGNVSKLRDAWKDKAVTFDTAQVPSGESRHTGDYFEFFDPAKGAQRIEYLEYHNWVLADAIRHFAAIAKTATDRKKLCGVFYGYYFFGENALLLDVGHRALAQVLAAPDIDFIACPYNYRERHSGGVAIPQTVAASVRLAGKICYIEDDTRTSLAPPDIGWGRAETLRDTLEIIKRNFALAMTSAGSLWWMEQSPGWFSHPEILRAIGALETFGRKSLETSAQRALAPRSEIAVFVSDESARYMRYHTSLIEPLINAFCVEQLPRLGAPYDCFLTSDLERLAADKLLGQYKLVIFLNAPFLDARQRALIQSSITCGGRTTLWIGCPGYISEESMSTANLSSLLGMEIVEEGYGGKVRLAIMDFDHDVTRELPRNLQFGVNEPTGPLFWCVDKQAQHLGELYCMPALDKNWQWRTGMVAGKTGLAVKQQNGWRSVWCGVPNLPSPLLRSIAKTSGVHIYLDTDDVVYANELLLAVHTRYTGPRRIALPQPARVIDALTQTIVVENAASFDVQLQRGATGLWLLK